MKLNAPSSRRRRAPAPPEAPAGCLAPPDTGEHTHALGFLLKQLHQHLNSAIEAKMREHGLNLTFPRAVALMSLIEQPGLSGAQMAREAMVSPQTMHQILLRLQEDGLVARSADPVHGRVQRTEITLEGRALFQQGYGVATGVIEQVMAGLDTHERSELTRLLLHCLNNVMRAAHQPASIDTTDT
jgi:DNA-binding MarR family transcriptional regulator